MGSKGPLTLVVAFVNIMGSSGTAVAPDVASNPES